jgi:hypothetical protein
MYLVAYYRFMTLITLVFARRPVVPFLQPAVKTMTFSTMDTEEGREQLGESSPNMKKRSTQTDYRESEAQTTPWSPPVFTRCASTPEVLTLANLSWGEYDESPSVVNAMPPPKGDTLASKYLPVIKEMRGQVKHNLHDKMSR